MPKLKEDSKVGYWIGAILVGVLVAGCVGFLSGGGCHKPAPVVVVPPVPIPPPEPPKPIVGKIKKLILVRESGEQSDLQARLVESLRGGKGEAWLAEKEIELELLDPGDVNNDGKPSALVERWKAEFADQKLPILMMLDDKDRLVRKAPIAADAALATLQSILADESVGEASFAAQPFVDAVFADFPQFVPGDTTPTDTFEPATEPELKGAEPKFGQDLPRGPPEPGVVAEVSNEPVFEDAIPLIPRDQWPTAIKAIDEAGGSLDLLVTRIYDQGQEGSCVSNATCQSLEIAQAVRRGKKHVVHLSAISLYKRVGRSPGSGSMVSANMREILDRGVLPLKSAENDPRFAHTMPNTGFHTAFPAGWEKTALRFRGHEVFDVRSYDGFITALLRGYPVVYGRSGHSICAVRPVYRGGKLYVRYANSWGNWGENGYGYDSEAMIRSGANWAFAVRTVVDPGLAAEAPIFPPVVSLASKDPLSGTVFDPHFALAP